MDRKPGNCRESADDEHVWGERLRIDGLRGKHKLPPRITRERMWRLFRAKNPG
jgi:hypothetical protein